MNQTRWNRIEELLQAALDLQPDARPAFLQRACDGDNSLRREVERLLDKEGEAEHFIETPALANLNGQHGEPVSALQPGQQVSHYYIEERIGAGGMGEVWRARDEILKRVVALKMLSAEFTAEAERVRRFEQEALAASRLSHPNIITIFEIIHTENAHFIATEFVEGQTLRQVLTDPVTNQPRRVSVEEAVEIATQITSALKAAHSAWIIHRDIKPENVMVRADGLVKVLDFGIAKLDEKDEGGRSSEKDEGGRMKDESRTLTSSFLSHPSSFRNPSPLTLHPLTKPGAIMGTASYMSPEQARGETLDGRTDIFSLGLVLYEMVTGQRLLAEVKRAQAGQDEPLPPEVKFEQVPKELEKIIRRMLRHQREERYATAGDLLADLQRLKRRRESRTARRVVGVSALAVVVALALVALAAVFSVNEVWEERVMRDGHTAAVRRAVFSPDGRLLVSVGEDRQVIVWDFARRQRLATFSDHRDWIAAVAFAPDGKRFATASLDGTVIVWDAVKLRKEIALDGSPHKLASVSFSPDGRVLLACARETILWRVGSWEEYSRLPAYMPETGTPLFLAGNSAMLYPNGVARLPNTWDLTTGQPIRSQFDPAWKGNNVVLSPDATRLVSVDSTGEVLFADVKRRRTLHRYQAHQDNGRAAAFSPDGRLAVTGAENIILWDALTCQKITTIDYPSIVWSATFSPDGRWLVSTHGDGAIRVWDLVERQRTIGFNEHNGPVRAVAWARDGKRFASAGEDRSIMIWDAQSERRESLLAGHSTRVTGLAFAPDGRTLASADRDGELIIWDIEQRVARLSFCHPKGHREVAFCLALSPDGRLVATSHGVYERATGRPIFDFSASGLPHLSPSVIYGLAFSANGERLAVAHAQGQPSLLETATWRLIGQIDANPLQFISVSFAPDGERLVTGEDGGAVRLWTAQPLRPTAVIGQHAARIKAVAFSPDGTEVVSAGDDKMIALWHLRQRRLITRVGLHISPVYAVAFSPDGRQLVSGEHDHSVRLYTRRRTLWEWRLD
jgi:WD40 repeat protein